MRIFCRTRMIINSLLAHLIALRGNDVVSGWQTLASQHAWDELVTALLEQHYDPAYNKSLSTNYAPSAADLSFTVADLAPTDLHRLARDILSAERPD